MKLKKFILVIFIIANQILISQVKVVLDSVYSPSLNSFKHFHIVLPENYFKTEERFIAIYLLHGYGGSHQDWVNKTSLVKYLKDYNFIIITPEADNGWYTNSPTLKNKNYEDYIIKDLIPYVEKKYRVISTRHGRIIAGLSMGGYGAIKFALKYPNMFLLAGSFSGAFNWEQILERGQGQIIQSLKDAFGEAKTQHWHKNNVFSLVDSVAIGNLPYLYISVGKDDNRIGLLEANRNLVEKLQKKNINYEYHELPGSHTWSFWDMEIKNFLRRVSEINSLTW